MKTPIRTALEKKLARLEGVHIEWHNGHGQLFVSKKITSPLISTELLYIIVSTLEKLTS